VDSGQASKNEGEPAARKGAFGLLPDRAFFFNQQEPDYQTLLEYQVYLCLSFRS
jgi:hypothetical protein